MCGVKLYWDILCFTVQIFYISISNLYLILKEDYYV